MGDLGFRVFLGPRVPIVEKRMEKQVEHELQTWVHRGIYVYRV